MQYDARGRKVAMQDPDMGSWSYVYNALGELTKQTDAKGQVTTMAYDILGRRTTRVLPEGTSTWTYDTAANGKGRLANLAGPGGYEATPTYDTSSRNYDHETGDLLGIQTGTTAAPASIQNLGYSFDAIDSLTSRTDTLQNLTETFGYDGLNRLTNATGAVAKTYSYNAIGNIITKSDVGTYTYNASGPNSVRPHAVTSTAGTIGWNFTYDANGNMTGRGSHTLAYTSFNKPKQIQTPQGTTTFTYDPNDNRMLKTAASGTTVYVGGLYEKLTNGSVITHRHYIHGGASLVAIYTSKSDGTSNTQYVHTDHLDSVSAITDSNGNVVQRLSYDPFGKRRNLNGTELGLTDLRTFNAQTKKGYTRHEMDDEVLLINMNARLYDPIIGRFTTPDTIVPGAGNSQSYNRYSYVNNSPLSYTDPTGHSRLSRWYKKNKKKIMRAAMFAVGGPTALAAGVNSQKIVEKISGVNYVGGLLRTGFLANNHFGLAYGLETGDWRSVAQAQATAMVIAAGAWAGGTAAGAYSSAVTASTATAMTYVTAGSVFVAESSALGYGSGYALMRINGASSADARAAGGRGAEISAVMALMYMGYQAVTGMNPEQASNSENTIGDRVDPDPAKNVKHLCPEGGVCSQKLYDSNLGVQPTSRIHDPMTGSSGVGIRAESNPSLAKFVDLPIVGVAYNWGTMPIAWLWTEGAYAAHYGISPALAGVQQLSTDY